MRQRLDRLFQLEPKAAIIELVHRNETLEDKLRAATTRIEELGRQLKPKKMVDQVALIRRIAGELTPTARNHKPVAKSSKARHNILALQDPLLEACTILLRSTVAYKQGRDVAIMVPDLVLAEPKPAVVNAPAEANEQHQPGQPVRGKPLKKSFTTHMRTLKAKLTKKSRNDFDALGAPKTVEEMGCLRQQFKKDGFVPLFKKMDDNAAALKATVRRDLKLRMKQVQTSNL